MTTPAACGARSATAAARSRVRACRTTSCPSAMRTPAAPRPSPSVEPVMKTRDTDNDPSFAGSAGVAAFCLIRLPGGQVHSGPAVIRSWQGPAEEAADVAGDGVEVAFQEEVAAVQQVDFGSGRVFGERAGA